MPDPPDNLVARPWRPEDIPRIVAIEVASFGEPWSEAMIREELDGELGHCDVVVGGPRQEILGFSLYWLVAEEVHLLVLAVDPAWRRRGVARRLMAELERRGAAGRATVIDLEVRPTNQAARAFYRALGFDEVGLRPRYYANREDAVLLRRTMGPSSGSSPGPSPGP